MSSWKTLMHKNAIKIVGGVKSVVLFTKIQVLFVEKNLGAFFGAFWLIWGASWFKHISHPELKSKQELLSQKGQKNKYGSKSGWLKCLNQEAPQFSQKAPKKAPKFFSPKSACILGKSTTDLTPQTIFIAFLCIKVFQLDIFLKIIYVIFETLFSFYLFCVKY